MNMLNMLYMINNTKELSDILDLDIFTTRFCKFDLKQGEHIQSNNSNKVLV